VNCPNCGCEQLTTACLSPQCRRKIHITGGQIGEMRISDGEYLEIINQNINLLIQDVRDLQAGQQRVEAKVDAMEHRLLPPGCLYIPKPDITPSGQTANVCISDPFHVAETHTEGK